MAMADLFGRGYVTMDASAGEVMLTRMSSGLLVLVLAGGLCACAPRGSSFETLGVPLAQERPGKGAIVLGWASEHREGWTAKRVRVDTRTRREWTPETQSPAVIHLTPGAHTLRVYAALADGSQTRRIKIRPLAIELAEGEVLLCVMDVGGAKRRRPRVRCLHYLGPEAPTQEPANVEARATPEQPEPAGDCPNLADVFERLERLEQRIEKLNASPEPASRQGKSPRSGRARQKGFVPSLDIDTEYPLSRKKDGGQSYHFDPDFESRGGQGQQPGPGLLLHRFDPNFQDTTTTPTKTKR